MSYLTAVYVFFNFNFNGKIYVCLFFSFEQSVVLRFVLAEASRFLGDLYCFSVGPGEKERQ